MSPAGGVDCSTSVMLGGATGGTKECNGEPHTQKKRKSAHKGCCGRWCGCYSLHSLIQMSAYCIHVRVYFLSKTNSLRRFRQENCRIMVLYRPTTRIVIMSLITNLPRRGRALHARRPTSKRTRKHSMVSVALLGTTESTSRIYCNQFQKFGFMARYKNVYYN